MWGRTETSRPDTADVPALGFGYLAVRNHVPHALLSGRATRMGMWVLQGRCSLTRAPQDFNGSQEVPPCRADAEGEAAGFSVTQSCSHRRLGVGPPMSPPTGLGPPFSTAFLLSFLLSFLPQICSIPRKQGQWPRDGVTSGVKAVSLTYKQPFQGCSGDQICDGTDSLTRPAQGAPS